MLQNPAPTQWQYTVTFCDILAILGLLIGIAGVGIAIYQTRKAASAQKAVEDFRQKLFLQRAALRFSELAPKTLLLVNRIRIKNWPECAELGTEIGAGLANATGFCSQLILTDERTSGSLELATDGLQYILEQLPVDPAQAMDAQIIQEMTKKCMLIVYGVERIAGRLKSLDDPGEVS
jgi:hypothetical protein